MALKFRAPKGTKDLVYPRSEWFENVVRAAVDILEVHGYRRISTPVLESAELFRRSIGEHTDIVTKEMYTFEDRGGERLTLRPEGTAPVIRAYLENSLSLRGLPQKIFYVGPMFRRERPQKGRLRQFHQIGAEAVGTDDPFLDAEIISLSETFFRRLGLSRYDLLLNSVGCAGCRPSYIEVLREYLSEVSGGLCEQCARRAEQNPMRVFDCKEKGCAESLKGAPLVAGFLCGACREHFSDVMEGLELMGIPFRKEDRMVRGLDYYSRTTFEFRFPGLGVQDTVSAGGRYDYLAEELGGPHTPGVGFSLGIERLLMAMEAAGVQPPEPRRITVFVASLEGVERSEVMRTVGALRDGGISTDTDYMGRSLKAQMRQADRVGARFAVIVGGAELERGEVVLRDLDGSDQWNVPAVGLPSRIRALEQGE